MGESVALLQILWREALGVKEHRTKKKGRKGKKNNLRWKRKKKKRKGKERKRERATRGKKRESTEKGRGNWEIINCTVRWRCGCGVDGVEFTEFGVHFRPRLTHTRRMAAMMTTDVWTTPKNRDDGT